MTKENDSIKFTMLCRLIFDVQNLLDLPLFEFLDRKKLFDIYETLTQLIENCTEYSALTVLAYLSYFKNHDSYSGEIPMSDSIRKATLSSQLQKSDPKFPKFQLLLDSMGQLQALKDATEFDIHELKHINGAQACLFCIIQRMVTKSGIEVCDIEDVANPNPEANDHETQ